MRHLLILCAAFIFLPSVALAQRYLVDLPIDTQGSFNEYINLLYKLSISVAALLAVVKIIIAGAKYMLSDIVTQKSDAKRDIKGALLGLLLILGAVVILNTINPALTDGGINVRALDVPPIGGAGPVGALNAVIAGLPACAVSTNSNTNDYVQTSVNISACDSGDHLTITRDFFAQCRERGGSTGTGANLTCSVPVRVERFAVGEFKTTSDQCLTSGITYGVVELGCTDVVLDAAYVTRTGLEVTYDARRFCEAEYPSLGLTACMEEVKDAFTESDDVGDLSGWLQNTYCNNNAGQIVSDYVCRLPSATYSLEEAQEDSTTEIVSQEDYELICREHFNGAGILVDTQITWTEGVDDYMCVVY